MACVLSVVSTYYSGPEDIIISKDLGISTDVTIESISEGILEFIQNKDNFNKDLIRKSGEARFSDSAVVKELEKVYSVLAG